MKYDYIIVGKGIAGTMLSYELLQNGFSAFIIDDGDESISSRVAGALINPVNVNKGTAVENAAAILSAAKNAYTGLEELLHTTLYKETALYCLDNKNIIGGSSVSNPYLTDISDDELLLLKENFNCFSFQKIQPLLMIDAKQLLQSWRMYLQQRSLFTAGYFDMESLRVENDKVFYEDVSADKIIFCEGAKAIQNKYFMHLPFTRNRGDVLIIETDAQLPEGAFQFEHLKLIPLENKSYWCGSNYKWNYEDLQPDEQWRIATERILQSFLKVSFRVKRHIVAERPTTAGQKVFSGFLKKYPRIGILNGLGTRGFSLAPLAAKEFVKKIQSGHTCWL